MRKKIFTFLLALTASIGMMWAETVVVINKSEFTSSGVTKEGVTLAPSNGSMTSSNTLAMDGSFEFSTSLGKFTGITIETDINIMEINEGAYTSAGWPTGQNLGTSAAWTGESEKVLISCMVAGNNITITCTIEPTPAPTPTGDKLSGVFSVSADKAVNFSKGNLQYDSENQIWQFAANQWDYIGNAAGNKAITVDGIPDNSGIVDLFGWVGASSTWTGLKQYGISTSTTNNDYGSVYGEALKQDWGNTMGSDWRTLTKDEWNYLFKTRNNAANLRTLATVNDKTGLIIMPDGWTASSVALTITTANYTTNNIGSSDWSTLEEQGCVFLPAAGSRNGNWVMSAGTKGHYWSSTSRPDGASLNSFKLVFMADDVDPTDHTNRYTGLSVRLVSDAASGGGSTPATGLQVVEVTSDIYNGWKSNSNQFSVNALPGFQAVTFDEAKEWTGVPTSGTAVLVYRTNGDYARVIQFFDGTISDYDIETDFNQIYENITIFGNRFFYTVGGGSTPTPTPTDEQVSTNEDPENPGTYYYSTFFHSTQKYALTNDGTQAFIADLSNNELVLTEIAHGEQVIPANTAVILRKSGSNAPVVLTPTDEEAVTFTAHNSLQGVDDATPIADKGMTQENCYVLSGMAQYGVGFYKINGNTLKAHKAYVIYTGSAAPKRMRFVFNQEQTATGVDQVPSDQVQSTKILRNGQLVIIKNGVKYNAQGQIVK